MSGDEFSECDGDASDLLTSSFGPGPAASRLSVPGRVNLIGEHIDYHNLPVLPMAIHRQISIAFRRRADTRVRVVSSGTYGKGEFVLSPHLDPGPPGDWVNYLKAGAQAAGNRWALHCGIDAAITSNLPSAAGLSSSSALLVAFTLALLAANNIRPSFVDLMDILPEGEQFVGTRGGGMDHAVILAASRGCALLVNFAPLSVAPIPIPHNWSFIVAHSLTTAEKSGATRSQYNARRAAGLHALARLGFDSFSAALETQSSDELVALARQARDEATLSDDEFRSFVHVVSESKRVEEATAAMTGNDREAFGQLLFASHASLRDDLRVSSPALDALVAIAADSGALGARLTGAGFGGCVVILCEASRREKIRAELVNRYHSQHPAFDAEKHIIFAQPSAGALKEDT